MTKTHTNTQNTTPAHQGRPRLGYAPFGITGVAAGRILSVAVVAVGGRIALRRRGFDGAPWA